MHILLVKEAGNLKSCSAGCNKSADETQYFPYQGIVKYGHNYEFVFEGKIRTFLKKKKDLSNFHHCIRKNARYTIFYALYYSGLMTKTNQNQQKLLL